MRTARPCSVEARSEGKDREVEDRVEKRSLRRWRIGRRGAAVARMEGRGMGVVVRGGAR